MGESPEEGVTYLLDTNVLVYTVDASEQEKRAAARSLLRRLGGSGQAVLTVQVLAEFANVALLKLEPAVPPGETYRIVEHYQHTFRVLPLTPAVVLEAIRGVRDHRLGYYDAQIWAAARLNQVPYVLSEDFNSGATLDGVTFLNPFAPDVDVEQL